MKTGEYWRKRFKLLEEAQNDTSVTKAHEVQEQFRRSQAVIENKINAWYQRLADNNGVSMTKARELLRKNELEEFRWSVEEYIKAGKENAKNQIWQKELENASAKVHISRLEALKMQTQAEVEKLFGNVTDAVDGHIRGTYENGFYHTAYEIQKGIGIGSPIQRLDGRTVDKIVSKPWAVDGKDFSGRIWENRTKLVNKLNNSLTKMCITGASPDAAIREIGTSMKVSRKQAVKVIMTESAAFSNLARKECMNELDVEQFEVVETLDGITCKVCTEMDGKHYPMSEYVIGVTAPPFHPLCRGCTCPYFNDEFSQDSGRAARDADGRIYYVPADMTYKAWKDSFVDGEQKSGIIKAIEVPKALRYAKGMTEAVLSRIQGGIDTAEREYDIRFDNILVENLSTEKPDVPYFCRYTDLEDHYGTEFVLNSGFDFTGFEEVITNGYKLDYFAGKTIEDHIFHEMVHCMTVQHISDKAGFRDLFSEIEKKYIPGISGYSDEMQDGFETIAEAAVRMRNGEEIPEDAKELVNEYIERWKKK